MNIKPLLAIAGTAIAVSFATVGAALAIGSTTSTPTVEANPSTSPVIPHTNPTPPSVPPPRRPAKRPTPAPVPDPCAGLCTRTVAPGQGELFGMTKVDGEWQATPVHFDEGEQICARRLDKKPGDLESPMPGPFWQVWSRGVSSAPGTLLVAGELGDKPGTACGPRWPRR